MIEEHQSTQPPPFKFKCPTCQTSYSFSDFTTSIIQRGLILLDGISHCWFGCTCSFCADHSTIIQKFPKNNLPQELAELYNCIYGDRIWEYSIDVPASDKNPVGSESFASGQWEYNSFPYTFIHKSQPFFSFKSQLPPNSKWLNDFNGPGHDYDDLNPEIAVQIQDAVNNSNLSYIRGSRISEPAIKVLWFKEDEIDELVLFETAKKKKVFPRYTLYDSTWESMQIFCWNHALQLDFVKQISSISEIPLVEFLSMSSKKKVAQAYDFLTILDKPYSFSSINPSSQGGAIQLNIASEAVSPMESLNKNSIYFSKESRERITKKIWDHFNKDYIQEMLLVRSDKFISEFIELSKFISFSRKSVWDLKEQYLLEIHSAIISGYKRRVEQTKDAKYWQKQADEADKCFLNVKIVSQDPAINKLKAHIARFSKVVSKMNFNGPILLLGEKGTGKNHFAAAIHQALQRKGQFIKVDCGVKSENLFESELFGHKKGAFTGATENRKGAFEIASGGTLFLDEIGNISLNLQQKLLGVLQNWEYELLGSSETKKSDAFVIVATNANLEKLVEDGKFRGDLLDRLGNERIVIPPLRERKKDIPLFFKQFAKATKIDLELEKNLAKLDYDWPGNIRELVQIIEGIERKKIMYDDTSPISFEDLLEKIKLPNKKESSRSINKKSPPGNTKVTDDKVKEALANHNGNKSRAAEELGVTYATILRHSKKFDI